MRFYVLKLLFLTKFCFAYASFILELIKNVGTMLKEQFCPLQLFGVCFIIYLLGKTGMAVAFAGKSSKLAFFRDFGVSLGGEHFKRCGGKR